MRKIIPYPLIVTSIMQFPRKLLYAIDALRAPGRDGSLRQQRRKHQFNLSFIITTQYLCAIDGIIRTVFRIICCDFIHITQHFVFAQQTYCMKGLQGFLLCYLRENFDWNTYNWNIYN